MKNLANKLLTFVILTFRQWGKKTFFSAVLFWHEVYKSLQTKNGWLSLFQSQNPKITSTDLTKICFPLHGPLHYSEEAIEKGSICYVYVQENSFVLPKCLRKITESNAI